MRGFSKKGLVALCLFLFMATIASVYAAGYLMTSNNSPQVVVNPTPTPSPTPTPTPVPATMSLTVSTTSLMVGQNLVVNATVSDKTPNILVNFFTQDNVSVGTAYTNAQGVATLNLQPPVGNWFFHATATHP